MIRVTLRSRTTLVLPLLILSLITLSLTLITASADGESASSGRDGLENSPMPDAPQPKVDSRISDAELRDLQSVADHYGMSLEAAIDRYAWNDDLSFAVAEIRGAFPEDIAGAKIVDANNAWIAFKSGAPEGIGDAIQAFNDSYPGISVEVRTEMDFSEKELQRAIEAAHYAVFENPMVRHANTSHDYATGEITTVVVLEDSASDSALDELKAAAEQSIVSATRETVLDVLTVSLVQSSRSVLGGLDSGTEHIGGED